MKKRGKREGKEKRRRLGRRRRGRGRTEQREIGWREKSKDGEALEWKKRRLLQLRRSFFVLFCFFGHGQSVTLAFVERVMNYTPPLLLPAPLLWCSSSRLDLLQYLRCEFSMPVYQPGFFWTGIEKWLFEKSLWWWAQFVFTAKKFVWTLWNVGWRGGPVPRGPLSVCLSAVITSYDLIDLRILLYSSVSSQSERRSFRKLLVRMHGYYNRKDGVIRLRADVTTNGHKLVNADSQTFTQMIKLHLYF